MPAALRLVAVLVLCSLASALAQSGRLEPGDPQLQSGEYVDVHEYQGFAGETLRVVLSSTEFDPYLVVLGADGTSLLQVDDSPGQGLNVDVGLTLPADGTYLIVVTSAFAGETGAYALTLTGGGAQAAAPGGGKKTIASAPARDAPPAATTPPAPAGPVLAPGPRPTPPALGGAPVPGIAPRPGYVTGTVFDTQGRPLPGATVLITGVTFGQGQEASAEVVTGVDGTYAVRMPDGRYGAKAWIDVPFMGLTFPRHLHPLTGPQVDTTVGGNLDFQWALTGLASPPGGWSSDYYGGSIDLSYCGLPADAYCSFDYEAFPERPIVPGGSTVHVTLTPVAPLIDGSQGQVLTFAFTAAPQDPEYPAGGAPNAPAGFEAGGGGRLVLGADWEYHSAYLFDVPVGVYDLSAVAVTPEGRTQHLLVGLAPDDVEHASVRVSFTLWDGFSGRSYRLGGLNEVDVYIRD